MCIAIYRFANDTDYVIARALSAGIFKMVVTGNTLKKSRVAVSLSKTRPGFLYAAVGVHPHWSQKEWSDNSLKVPVQHNMGQCIQASCKTFK